MGRFLGFFVSAVFINEWNVGLHLSLSLSVGGLKPLFDIKNNARIGCKSNIGGCNSASSVKDRKVYMKLWKIKINRCEWIV